MFKKFLGGVAVVVGVVVAGVVGFKLLDSPFSTVSKDHSPPPVLLELRRIYLTAVLAQKLSVDKGEIQRAYFELEQSGLIKRETGKDFLGHAKTTYRVA